MQDLNALYYFTQVVDYKGYAPASRALEIPKSTLSRSIAKLETELGIRLINRTSRQFSVTEIGYEYYLKCLEVLSAAQAAQAVIEQHQTSPRGIIRLSCPTALLNFVVASMLARYMLRYPEVELHIESTNRQVDVIHEGFDIALRIDSLPLTDDGLVTKLLSNDPQELVASPQLLERLDKPITPASLHRFPSLAVGCPRKLYQWHLEHTELASQTIQHTPRLVTDDLITIRRAILEHLGIAQLPRLVVFKDLHYGLMQRVLPDWTPQGNVIYAAFPSRRGLLPSVRSLLDFLGESFQALDFNNLYEGYVKRGDEDACLLINA